MFHLFLSFDKVLHLVVIDYLIQVGLLFIFSPLAQFLMYWLKGHERIDGKVYSISANDF